MNRIRNCTKHFDRFRAYHAKEPVWGSLHVVLSDGNFDDDTVRFCLEYAEDNDDTEGAELARLLLRMSRTQREKISNSCVVWGVGR